MLRSAEGKREAAAAAIAHSFLIEFSVRSLLSDGRILPTSLRKEAGWELAVGAPEDIVGLGKSEKKKKKNKK